MRYKSIILLFLLSFLPIVDLFGVGLPLTHDGQDHVARIANFYQNIQEGNIIPRWAGNLNWGYGHPILMFLYPLPSYAASLFHFFGFSLIDSLKIVFGISFIASGFAMYLWIKEFLGEEAGIVAGVLYMFAPYRFVDLYVRGAIGEHVAFIFPPLICCFLLRLSKRYSLKALFGGSFSLAGFILSHNAITLMFLPLIFLYALYLLWQSQDRKLAAHRYALIAIFGFGLAAFFWIPAFFEGKYTLRDIVTKGGYAFNFVPFDNFLYGQWSYGGTGQFTVQVGIVHWIMMTAIFPISKFFWRKKKNLFLFTTVLIVLFFLTLFLMTKESIVIWQKITILQKFQFPWRFLSVTVFISALAGGICISMLKERTRQMLLVITIIIVILLTKNYWHARAYLMKDESFFTGIYDGTTDTGESAPIWSVRFMEKRPREKIEVIDGEASIKEIKRTSTMHVYSISSQTQSRIRENTLYFPGWNVYVDGQKAPIEFQDPSNRGLITFMIPSGEHAITAIFEETRLRLFANIISIVSLVNLLILGILRKIHGNTFGRISNL